MNEICSHMKKNPNKPIGYWNNIENLFNEAKKYKSPSQFENKNGYVCNLLRKNENFKRIIYKKLNWENRTL